MNPLPRNPGSAPDELGATCYQVSRMKRLFILDTCKHVHWQTVRNNMEQWRIMRHLIRVCTSEQSSVTGAHHFISILTRNPLKYKVGYWILIVSICMGYFIRMKRVKGNVLLKWPFSSSTNNQYKVSLCDNGTYRISMYEQSRLRRDCKNHDLAWTLATRWYPKYQTLICCFNWAFYMKYDHYLGCKC